MSIVTVLCHYYVSIMSVSCQYNSVFSVCQYCVSEKGKSVPLQAWTGAEGSRKLRLPDFMTTAQDGGRLSALHSGRLYSQEHILIINQF